MAQLSYKKVFQSGIFGARQFLAGIFRGRGAKPQHDLILEASVYISRTVDKDVNVGGTLDRSAVYVSKGVDVDTNVGVTLDHDAGIRPIIEFEVER